MNFWKNLKYINLEKSSENGDIIRAIPAKKFPWILKSHTFKDSDNDLWKIKIFCMNTEGNDISNEIKARIKLEALCYISENTCKKIKFNYQRLNNLDFKNWNTIEEQYELNFSCFLEKMESSVADFDKIFFEKITKKYNLEKKKYAIENNIKKYSLSNFS
jgi:hypothetical protein